MANIKSEKPIVGAALSIESVKTYRDWIFEKQRDLELQDFCFAEVLNGDWSGLVSEYKTLLDGYKGRMGIHGPFWGLDIANEDPEIRTLVEKRMMQGLDVVEALGATHMVIHSPLTTWDHNNLSYNPGSRDKLIDRTHATLSRVVTRAEQLGCVLVIENIEDLDPFFRSELADSFESDSVAVSIDTGHANYAHGSNGGPPVDYYIHAAAERLAHIHLQDTDGHADRHWAPGEGNIAWHEVFRALAQYDSHPRLILELRDHAKVKAGADYLMRLGLVE
ncbi:MAG: sugar phosphate isomerase/epimerase [Hyphomicrobiales bacterium]|nr:sugar phosphate isomerase/epimerase [Hyphomicrobiales bacterium]